MSTEGNVAIVTGAAQGIGRAIVTCLLSQSYQVGRFFRLRNGQQFHAYKKRNNHLPSQIIKHKKRPRHMTLEIQVLAWDRHKHLAGLNWLMGFQPLLDSWISNSHT